MCIKKAIYFYVSFVINSEFCKHKIILLEKALKIKVKNVGKNGIRKTFFGLNLPWCK